MKLFVQTLVLASLLAVLAGCGPSPAPTAVPVAPTDAPAATEPATPENAAPVPTDAPATEPATEPATQLSVITVGIDPAFEPFVFVKDGKLAGFDVDLLNAIAADADFEVAYVITPFDELFDGLQNGKFDAAISAVTVTDARKQLVDFTAPYFESGKAAVSFYNPGQGIAIRTGNTAIVGPESLVEGVRVGVKKGTTGAAFAAENTRAELVEFAESQPAIEALVAGDVDAVIVDIPVIVGYIKSNPNAGIQITGGPVTDEAYAIAVAKSRPDVLAVLDAALARVKENGTYDQLYNRWFGTP